MRQLRRYWPVSPGGTLVCLFIVVAMIFGGSGSPSARPEALVQIAFAACATGWFIWAVPDNSGTRPVPALLLVIGAMVLGIALVQLVPLPPAAWQALPGRGLEADALALIDAADRWRPISLAPHETFAAVLAMVPAVGTMIAVSLLDEADRDALILTIVVLALAGIGLGVLQMAGGPDDFRLYEKSHRGWLVAFHANRNAAADVILIGSLAMAAWTVRRSGTAPLSHTRLGLYAAVQLMLLVALAMTGSRAGIMLGVVALAVQWGIFRSSGLALMRGRLLLGGAAAASLLIGALVYLAANARLARVADRFDAAGDFRSELWRDSWSAMEAYFPIGSGIGTFAQAFLPFERLEVVDPAFPNRAHNDFLELLIETGLAGPLLLLAISAILVRLAIRGWRSAQASRSIVLFAVGTLLVIALHSVVDYPLRNMAVAVLAGVAAGLLGGLATNASGGSRWAGAFDE